MKVLFLGPADSPVLAFLRNHEDEVLQTMDRLDPDLVRSAALGFLVSYGYRHILRREILDLFAHRAINLHISYLPWNRGADPNFWSFVDQSPKGVTIHLLDEGVDTGPIIAQRRVELGEDHTLATSYERLQAELQDLFYEEWQSIRSGRARAQPQPEGGTVHRRSDLRRVGHLLVPEGWNTPVSRLVEYGRRLREGTSSGEVAARGRGRDAGFTEDDEDESRRGVLKK